MASFFLNDVRKSSPDSTGVGPEIVEEVLIHPIEKELQSLDIMVGMLTSQGKLDAVQKVKLGTEILKTATAELQQIVSGIEETAEERSTPGSRM